ncbi:Rgg/GadR/MutR family transcriptional regulator [Lactococcus allomyrinae]|uniref:Rgg/GadR/MutR family transcriptional regulator n=1 Tax=Lactococcus allomyrinae TaxID=2419773 RepID=A0A387BG42_9LACT|nr:Rgg/GadR/MutR family transcriptional regulator [Lactococcus allomyrinae]AYG01244.1 Rgg/GadR/MutR family transcriptional regulator [Lactococcus allomyrinae]
MDEKKDLKLGKIISMLRRAKNLRLREVTQGYFSESLLARFEKGKSDITVEKFFVILKNSNIYLDEFQSIYNDYSMDEEEKFRTDLANAYSKRDIVKIKGILKFWESKVHEKPSVKYFKINETVIRIILAMAQNSVVLKKDVDFLMNYLEQVTEWGRYELWIFSNCLRFFDDNSLKYYGKYILGKTNFYQSIHLNQQLVIRTFLNIIDTFLRRGNLIFALKYINYLESINIQIDFFYEKIILNYHKAHYRVLQKQKSAINDMKKCVETLEYYGYGEEAKILYEEIENL